MDDLSDEDIARECSLVNVGSSDEHRRRIVTNAALKVACGYSNGSTYTGILMRLGLVTGHKLGGETLTRKGKLFLWDTFKQEPTP